MGITASAMRCLGVLFAATLSACGNSEGSHHSGAGGQGSGGSAGTGTCEPPLELYCNGACLQHAGQEGGGCTELTGDFAYGLAVDASSVYYSAATSIERLDAAALVPQTLVDVPAGPYELLVDSGIVYFDTQFSEPAIGGEMYDGTLRSVPVNGGAATLLTQAMGSTIHLALVGSLLYFGVGTLDFFDLMSLPVTGGSATKIGFNNMSAFAIDGATFYFTVSSSPTLSDTTLYSEALADPLQQAPLADLGLEGGWLSVDGTYVYFAGVESTTGQYSYGRVAKADGALEVLRTSALEFSVKAADADVVYLLEMASDGKRLLALPRGGGQERTLATFHDTHDGPVAVDASYVYVGTEAGIVRVAK